MSRDFDPSAADPTRLARTSDLLEALLAREVERLSFADLVAAVGDRAFGALLLVFAVPNMIPTPFIGLSGLLGWPLILFSAQLAAGRRAPWVPHWLSRRSMARGDARSFAARILPRLRRAERLLKPRWPALTAPAAERLLGAVCLILAIALTLPIPFGNFLPALAISAVALALIEKDGVAAALGLALSVVSIAIVAVLGIGVAYAVALAAVIFLREILGFAAL